MRAALSRLPARLPRDLRDMIYVEFWRNSPVKYRIMEVKVFNIHFTHATEYDKPPLIADPEQVGHIIAREAVKAFYAYPLDKDT